MPTSRTPTVALIPCAGHATRLGDMPCSKELMPLVRVLPNHPQPPGVDTLLDLSIGRCSVAGIRHAIVPLRPEKADLVSYLRQSSRFGVRLAPVPVPGTRTVLDSLRVALDCIRREHVLLIFPDILFTPADAIQQAAQAYATSDTDLLLALIPADRPDKYDMVELHDDGRVREIHIKKSHTGGLRYGWAFALWAPAFTKFSRRHLHRRGSTAPNDAHMGQVMRAWMAEGGSIHTIRFPYGIQLDLGTWDDLARAPALFPAATGEYRS